MPENFASGPGVTIIERFPYVYHFLATVQALDIAQESINNFSPALSEILYNRLEPLAFVISLISIAHHPESYRPKNG